MSVLLTMVDVKYTAQMPHSVHLPALVKVMKFLTLLDCFVLVSTVK